MGVSVCEPGNSTSSPVAQLMAASEDALGSGGLGLLLELKYCDASDVKAAMPPSPNAAISWGRRGRDFRRLICLRF
jgi:hypothetical protein